MQDVELGKLTNKEEQHEAELRETRRHMEDKMREFQIDAVNQFHTFPICTFLRTEIPVSKQCRP